MAIKTSGELKLRGDIGAELGITSGQINIGSAATRNLAGKPSGRINFSDFYGKSDVLPVSWGAVLHLGNDINIVGYLPNMGISDIGKLTDNNVPTYSDPTGTSTCTHISMQRDYDPHTIRAEFTGAWPLRIEFYTPSGTTLTHTLNRVGTTNVYLTKASDQGTTTSINWYNTLKGLATQNLYFRY